MSKRSLYDTNNRKILNPDKIDDAILGYLQSHEKGTTQIQMEKDLNIKQPTISNRLKKIGSNPFIYGNDTYIIIRERGIFQLIKLKNLSRALGKDATKEQKHKFNELLQKTIGDFVEFKMFEEECATEVSTSVILYKTKERYYEKVKSSLYELYNKDIFDILPCEQGLYIILNANVVGKRIDLTKDSILSLYSDVAEIIHRKKARSRAKKEN